VFEFKKLENLLKKKAFNKNQKRSKLSRAKKQGTTEKRREKKTGLKN